MDATMYEKDGKGHTDGMQKTVSRTQVIEHASRRIDLHNNVGAKLRNPLAGVPREVLMADVEAFVAEKGLENHLPAFKKGALLAQHPVSHCRPELCGLSEIASRPLRCYPTRTCQTGFENMSELTQEEKTFLAGERDHRWRHPLTLYLTIALCSIGAAVQGWDQTGSNGANLSFPTE
jgi:hypothetical protein